MEFPISWMVPKEAAELALLRAMYNAGPEKALTDLRKEKKAVYYIGGKHGLFEIARDGHIKKLIASNKKEAR